MFRVDFRVIMHFHLHESQGDLRIRIGRNDSASRNSRVFTQIAAARYERERSPGESRPFAPSTRRADGANPLRESSL
jgi:hypothetical protein